MILRNYCIPSLLQCPPIGSQTIGITNSCDCLFIRKSRHSSGTSPFVMHTGNLIGPIARIGGHTIDYWTSCRSSVQAILGMEVTSFVKKHGLSVL